MTERFFEVLSWGLAGILLLPGSFQDIRQQSVSKRLLKMSGVLTSCLCLFRIVISAYKEQGSPAAWETVLTGLVFGLVPGVLLLMASFFRKDSVGKGDGIAVLILGFLLGTERVFLLAFFSLLLASLWSIILLALKKVAFDTHIPFFPFLTFGSALVLIMELLYGFAK